MTTKIEWATETWNIITGCSGKGCNLFNNGCYAQKMAVRLAGRFGYDKGNPFYPTFHPNVLDKPLHWKKPRRIFVSSMGEFFDEGVKREWRDAVMDVVARCPQHVFMFLTKQAEAMHVYIQNYHGYAGRPVPSNAWFGVSVTNQADADERIPWLLGAKMDNPHLKAYISAEPLLGIVELMTLLLGPGELLNAFNGVFLRPNNMPVQLSDGLDLVIVGGMSGARAKPMHPDWARKLRDQSNYAGVSYFFKQWGAFQNGSGAYSDGNKNCTVFNDGSYLYGSIDTNVRFIDESKAASAVRWNRLKPTTMCRVGKKRSGRLLDGREWNEMPEVKP